MSLELIIAITILAIFGVLVVIFGRRAELRRAWRFRNRPVLSVQEFWEQFYRESGVPLNTISDALQVLETATSVPKGRLRPEDRFAKELAPEKGWEFDDGLAELRWELESRGRARESVVLTVDDFIRVFAGHLSSEPRIQPSGSSP
jgi:hypothetical protein